MNESLEHAKIQYQSVEIPPELGTAVSSALRVGERKRCSRRAVHRAWGTGLAACACFFLLVNGSPAFASAISDVPLLKHLARIVTVERYQINDRDHLVDVRLPALADTGDTDLEQRINTEIKTRIDQVLLDAEDRAKEARAAYVETGGQVEDFIPIIINVDYDIKCSNGHTLSFLVSKTETLANAYTELYTYNLDLTTGKTLTLRDVLGPHYREKADAAIRAEIVRRTAEKDALYFDPNEGGFTGISADQKFYINEQGDPVILFEKYEISPGYMGIQEFTVPLTP